MSALAGRVIIRKTRKGKGRGVFLEKRNEETVSYSRNAKDRLASMIYYYFNDLSMQENVSPNIYD